MAKKNVQVQTQTQQQQEPKSNSLPPTIRLYNHSPRAVTYQRAMFRDGKYVLDESVIVALKPSQETKVPLDDVMGHRMSPQFKHLLFNGSINGIEVLGGLDEDGIAVELDHESALQQIYTGDKLPPPNERLKKATQELKEFAELGKKLEQAGDIRLKA